MDKKQYEAIARMLGMKLDEVMATTASTLGGMVKALIEKEGIADQFVDVKDGTASAALAVAAFKAAFEKNKKLTVNEWVQSRRPTESTLDALDATAPADVAPAAPAAPKGPTAEEIATAKAEYELAKELYERAQASKNEKKIARAKETMDEAKAAYEAMSGKPAEAGNGSTYVEYPVIGSDTVFADVKVISDFDVQMPAAVAQALAPLMTYKVTQKRDRKDRNVLVTDRDGNPVMIKRWTARVEFDGLGDTNLNFYTGMDDAKRLAEHLTNAHPGTLYPNADTDEGRPSINIFDNELNPEANVHAFFIGTHGPQTGAVVRKGRQHVGPVGSNGGAVNTKAPKVGPVGGV